MRPEDYQPLVPMLEDAGVQAIDVMPGWYETRRPVNQMCVRAARSSTRRKRSGKWLACLCRPTSASRTPCLRSTSSSMGRADLIAICTPLMADPEWPLKAARAGSTTSGCAPAAATAGATWRAAAGHRVLRQRQGGMETGYVVEPAATRKRVWIVGAALREWRPPAWRPSGDIRSRCSSATRARRPAPLRGDSPAQAGVAGLHDVLTTQMQKLGVDVRLGTAVTAGEVIAAQPTPSCSRPAPLQPGWCCRGATYRTWCRSSMC